MKKEEIYDNLQKIIDKQNILCDEPMKLHTSFKIGGTADFFVKLNTKKQIQDVLEFATKNEIPLTVIGNGTNLLVTDKGIRGIVIKNEIADLDIKENKVTVGSGYNLAKLSQIALKEGLSGLEFACGIPGTVGGAVKGNAGAYGGQMQDIVVNTTYIDKNGNVKTIEKLEHKFDYRQSIFANTDDIILETTLLLKKEDTSIIKNKMDENKAKRLEKQLTQPSAGSTFKRGADFITAKLIDDAGLKGYKIGGAMISQKHAGFIINQNNATANDVIELIEHIKKVILDKFEKQIELEIKIIGEM